MPECIGFSEIAKVPCAILKYRFPEVRNYGDASLIVCDELDDFDFLCGGFPCQTFSVAGKRQGFADARGTMFFEIARVLSHKRPGHFLLENVEGLRSHEEGKTLQTILRILAELDYRVEVVLLNSKHYGVPQNRERIFFIGHSGSGCSREILSFGDHDCIFNETIRADEPRPQTEVSHTLRGSNVKADQVFIEAVGTLRTHKDGEGFREMSEEVSPTLNARARQDGSGQPIVAIPVLTPDRPTKRQNGRRFKENGDESFTLTSQDKHGVMIYGDRVTPTDTSGTMKARADSGRSKNHAQSGVLLDKRIRRLTPVECARLQGFTSIWKSLQIEISSDLLKSLVSADGQNHKSLNSAGIAMPNPDRVSQVIASSVERGFATSRRPIGKPAQLTVLINSEANEVEILSAERSLSFASSAEREDPFHPLTRIDDFVHLLAHISSIQDQIIPGGRVGSHPSGTFSTDQRNGRPPVKLFGNEIKQSVVDAANSVSTVNELLKSTTSSPSDTSNLEQFLQTSSLFAVRAMSGFINQEKPESNGLTIEFVWLEGWADFGTFENKNGEWHVREISDTGKYQVFGNAVTVDVIQAIVAEMLKKGCLE